MKKIANFKNFCVKSDSKISDVMGIIDEQVGHLVLVVDDQYKLLGTVTDGDIRRGLLSGIELQNSISEVMNTSPKKINSGTDDREIALFCDVNSIFSVPVVSEAGFVEALFSVGHQKRFDSTDSSVLIMAGGLGMRMRPLTETCPKPMLRLGGQPLLEIIVRQLRRQGFRKIVISVNYLANVIEEYFGNGSHWGVQVSYIREDHRMGTGGALSLLQEKADEPLLVLNGDVLCNVDFRDLLLKHKARAVSATMAVREFEYKIPYGVVDTKNNFIVNLREKPVERFQVNAGIYVISASAMCEIDRTDAYDMPDFFNDLRSKNHKTAAEIVHDFWIDIGDKDDFERAKRQLHMIRV